MATAGNKTSQKKTTGSRGSTQRAASRSAGGTAKAARVKQHARSAERPIPERGRSQSRRSDYRDDENVIKRDIIIITLFAAMIFLFLSNFGILGPVGNVFSNIMFGLVGGMAYIFPVFVFVAVLFYYANRDQARIGVKIGAASVLFLVVGMICELAAGRMSTASGYNLATLYTACVQERNGGGVIAGSFAYLFHALFGTFGTVLVLIIVSVICVVLITQRSLIDFVGDTAENAKLRHEERLRELEEEARYAEEESSQQDGVIPEAMAQSRARAKSRAVAEGDEDYGEEEENLGTGYSHRSWMDRLRERQAQRSWEKEQAAAQRQLERDQEYQEFQAYKRRRQEERTMQDPTDRADQEVSGGRGGQIDQTADGEKIFRGVQNTVLKDDPYVARQHEQLQAASGSAAAMEAGFRKAQARHGMGAGQVFPAQTSNAAVGSGAQPGERYAQTRPDSYPAGQDPRQAEQDTYQADQNSYPSGEAAYQPTRKEEAEKHAAESSGGSWLNWFRRKRKEAPSYTPEEWPPTQKPEEAVVSKEDDTQAGDDNTADGTIMETVSEGATELHEISAQSLAEAQERNTSTNDDSFTEQSSPDASAGFSGGRDDDTEPVSIANSGPDNHTEPDVTAATEPEANAEMAEPEAPYQSPDSAYGSSQASEWEPYDVPAYPEEEDFSDLSQKVIRQGWEEIENDPAQAAAAKQNAYQNPDAERPVLTFEDDELIPDYPEEPDAGRSNVTVAPFDTDRMPKTMPKAFHSTGTAPARNISQDTATHAGDEVTIPDKAASVNPPEDQAASSQEDKPAGSQEDQTAFYRKIDPSVLPETQEDFPQEGQPSVLPEDEAFSPQNAATAVSPTDAGNTTDAAAQAVLPLTAQQHAIPVHKGGVTDIADNIVSESTRPAAAPAAAKAADEDSRQLPSKKKYIYPPIDLLNEGPKTNNEDSANELRETASKLQTTLKTFGVNVHITDISQGPAVTRYEMQPEQGVKVSKIVGLQDDIKLALAATDIRIEAPIPGKPAVGIEVPNKVTNMVALRDVLDSPEFRNAKSRTTFGVGKDIAGKIVVADIAKMPHVLIAGATGSGKSVCINTIIMSLIYHASPEEVKLIMIDPKVVELSVYNGIPHLLLPVVTDSQKAAKTLNWCVAEMEARFHQFADSGVRDIKGYNALVKKKQDSGIQDPAFHFMPHIVIIVDELADLMMVAKSDVETAICRLAQLARAAGMHLVIATQRPSVDVITGLIKANMPSRIAFAVTQGVDSRTILDMNGAEKLLGKGDMLFFPQGLPKPQRIQGAFVSDEEVSRVVDFLKENDPPQEDQAAMQQKLENIANAAEDGAGEDNTEANGHHGPQRDDLFQEAGKFIIEKNNASIGLLQRMFRIGFNRAARIMDQLCDAGVVSNSEGTKPRKILMTEADFEQYCEENL